MQAAVDPFSINEKGIADRKAALELLVEDKPHYREKCKEFDKFTSFVASRQDIRLRRSSVFEALPGDVIDYFISRDVSGNGRTVVHKVDCETRGFSGTCACPSRLSAETVRTMVSKIRTMFYELGCAGPWNAESCTGNPADSRAVNQMVVAVQEEQAKAGCMVMSARRRALLPEKLKLLVHAMEEEAKRFQRQGKLVDFIRRKQDIAWLCVQYRSMNRGAELSALRIGNTVFGPNDCCVVFQFTFSKIMRDGSSNEFAVQAIPGDPTCPVEALKEYVKLSRLYLRWDWTVEGAFVFASFGASGVRSSVPVTAGAYAQRFQTYLVRAGLKEDETLHGLRAAGALTAALKGWTISEIMQQGYWKNPATALQYVGLLRLIVGEEFVRAVRASEGDFTVDVGSSIQNPYSWLP